MKPKKLPTEKRIMKKLRRLVVFLRGSVSGPPPAGFGSLRRSSLLDLRKSVPEGVLTKKKKKSIMIYEGFVVITRVWKRFQTVVTKQIGSTLNRFLNNFRPLGRRRSEMKNFAFSKMNGRFATVLAVALTALILTACGGGGGGSDVVAPPVVVTPPAAVAIEPSKAVVATGLCTPPSEAYTTVSNGLCLVTDTGPVRQAAKAAPRASASVSQAVAPAITPDQLFDWAEKVLPEFFPGHSTTIQATGFVFRFYAAANSYVAVKDDGGVYVLFLNGDAQVKYVAPITDFTCSVMTTHASCAPVLVMTSVSPLPVASPMVIVSNQPLKGISSVSIVSSNNESFAGNASLSSDKLSITIAPVSALPYSATLTVTVKATNEANVEGIVVATVATEAEPHGCVAPAVWNGTTCAAPLHYTDKVYALWTDKYPYVVTKTGVTKVKNMTQWNGLGKDLFLCFIANRPLADGKILTLCKDLAQLKWHTLYIDPIKEELYEYTAALPADLTYSVDPDSGIPASSLGKSWLDWDKQTAEHPLWYSYAKVTDGYFYAEVGSSGGLLKFVGNDGTVSIVADKNPDVNGTIQVMWGYNN